MEHLRFIRPSIVGYYLSRESRVAVEFTALVCSVFPGSLLPDFCPCTGLFTIRKNQTDCLLPADGIFLNHHWPCFVSDGTECGNLWLLKLLLIHHITTHLTYLNWHNFDLGLDPTGKVLKKWGATSRRAKRSSASLATWLTISTCRWNVRKTYRRRLSRSQWGVSRGRPWHCQGWSCSPTKPPWAKFFSCEVAHLVGRRSFLVFVSAENIKRLRPQRFESLLRISGLTSGQKLALGGWTLNPFLLVASWARRIL